MQFKMPLVWFLQNGRPNIVMQSCSTILRVLGAVDNFVVRNEILDPLEDGPCF